MVVTTSRTETETEKFVRTRRALIDCDFHNELDSIKDLYPYLSERWRTHIDTYGARGPAGLPGPMGTVLPVPHRLIRGEGL